MLIFFTKADRRKPFFDLFKISSVNDYNETLNSSQPIELPRNGFQQIHPDYLFIEQHLDVLARRASRLCFLSVFDAKKEIYLIKKYRTKSILLTDINKKVIEGLQNKFENVEVLETDYVNFVPKAGDLIILNIAEYFLSARDLVRLLKKCDEVILNNVHLYKPSLPWCLLCAINASRAIALNILSIFFCSIAQMQVRGWWRSESDFKDAANQAGLCVEKIIYNEKRTTTLWPDKLYSAMVHLKRKSASHTVN